MNRILKILEILDGFFQKGSHGLSKYNEDSITPHLEKIYESIDDTTSQPFESYIKELDSNIQEPTIKELGEKLSEIFGRMDESELLQHGKDVIKNYIEHIESVFYLTDMFEKNLYEKINPILRDLSNSYLDQFKNAAIWLLSIQEKDSNETESIILIHDELINLENNIDNVKFSDVLEIPNKIISKVEKLDSHNYKLYFRDWILKFSLLIESKFKPIFIFLNYFWRLDEKQEVSLSILDRNKMIGKIFKDFEIHQKYQNIDRFRVYRNKTFHAGVEFHYDEKWENWQIKLNNKGNVTINEFLFDFVKLFRFLNTFFLMVKIILINIPVDGKTPLEYFKNEHNI